MDSNDIEILEKSREGLKNASRNKDMHVQITDAYRYYAYELGKIIEKLEFNS